jgi:hypothetical protein
MLRLLAVIVCVVVSLAARSASAAECYPHCDYTHYYGPADLTYVQPGLFGYPRCGPRGHCSPNLAYAYSDPRLGRYAVFYRGPRTGRITIRIPSRTTASPLRN